MISLQPREQFTLVRQLPDHTDLTTYYVQAVIRNSLTGDVINTVNLDNKGSGRFTKIYEVPSDVSGLGFYIDITLSVYTDSGYTTKSGNHGDDNDQYLVFDRIVKHGGGGGVDVDYKKIAKILTESLKPLTDRKEINLAPVLAEIRGVMRAVDSIEMPEIEKMDHTPVLKAIGDMKTEVVKAIADKEVTEIPDMNPLKEEMMKAISAKEPNLEAVFNAFAGIKKILTDFVTEYTGREGAKQKLDEIKKALGPVFAGENFTPTPLEKKPDERITRLIGGKQ